jgi:hypothetical protein
LAQPTRGRWSPGELRGGDAVGQSTLEIRFVVQFCYVIVARADIAVLSILFIRVEYRSPF